MTQPTISTPALLEFAIDAVRQAGQFTLSYFQSGAEAEWKTDGSPVTAAARGAAPGGAGG